MTRNEVLVLGGLGVIGGLVVFACIPRQKEISDARLDPDLGRHRGRAAVYRPGAGIGAPIRLKSAQESIVNDRQPYSKDVEPSKLAQGYWKGPGIGPIGYTPIDYGKTPRRIPRLWRDGIRYWDGIAQRGYSQQNYRLFLFHLRPSAPTRGARSISGVLYSGGPTASRKRVPAVFVPTSVS